MLHITTQSRYNQRKPLKLSCRCSLFFVKSYRHKRPESTQCSQARYKWHDRSKGTNEDQGVVRKLKIPYFLPRVESHDTADASFSLKMWTHTHARTHTHALQISGGSKRAKSLVKILHRSLPFPRDWKTVNKRTT